MGSSKDPEALPTTTELSLRLDEVEACFAMSPNRSVGRNGPKGTTVRKTRC